MSIEQNGNSYQAPIIEQCWKTIGVMGDASCPKLEIAVHCRNCPVFMEAGQQLFERQPPTDYVDEQTVLLSEETASETAGSEAMIVFRIEEEWLALDVDVVVEVAEPRPVHRVPHRTDRLLMGIVNIRGELQLCISLRELLGIDGTDHLPGVDQLPHANGLSNSRFHSPHIYVLFSSCKGLNWIGLDLLFKFV